MPGTSLSRDEQDLRRWWSTNPTHPFAVLKSISIKGTPGLRGIEELKLDFRYPITVICGRNGSGKSTLLALAALAYHPSNGHVPLNARAITRGKKTNFHYTFSDFFYRGDGDANMAGVTIGWSFSDPKLDKGITKQSDKWMRYETRPIRPMHFIGLGRAVHPIEQRTLRLHFKVKAKPGTKEPLEDSMRTHFAEIIGKSYNAASSLTSLKKSTLRMCDSNGSYTGFNMGTGEDIVLGLLTLIQRSPKGTLLVIDEMEIGLFPQAQRKLMRSLIHLANERKLQIILSSHSEAVIDEVPREARILLQAAHGTIHNVVYGPTTRMAIGDMYGSAKPELTLLCEDAFAAHLIHAVLNSTTRRRVNICPVGSNSEIARAAAFNISAHPENKYAIVWDGDVSDAQIRGYLKDEVCKRVFVKPSARRKLSFTRLPGNKAPETFVVESLDCSTGVDEICRVLNCEAIEGRSTIAHLKAIGEPHNIPFELAQKAGLSDKEAATKALCHAFAQASINVASQFRDTVVAILDGTLDQHAEWVQIYPNP